MKTNAHISAMDIGATVTFRETTKYTFGDDGAESNVIMRIGTDFVGVYMDDEAFAALFQSMILFGVATGRMCPAHPGECDMVETICCGRELWTCETSIVRIAGTGFDRECMDGETCGLNDRDDVPSLADLSNGEGS